MQFLNRVKVSIATTGTGSVTVGSAAAGMMTPAQSGAVDGVQSTWILEEGTDWEIFKGTPSSSGTVISRDTVEESFIGGTPGTSKMDLGGGATLRAMVSERDCNTMMRAAAVAGGRLTLASGVPVMTTSQAAKTTIYYTPYVSATIPLYDGDMAIPSHFAELSQATTDTTKSPAAVTTNSNYDLFVWNDAGTLRLSRGPAWSSNTARGTGAGTTELVAVDGLLLNANAITNGPAAQRGTYVGTVRTNGSSSVDFIFGGAASGGSAAALHVWNAYNRVQVATEVTDNGASYTYASGTYRQARGSAGNQISFVFGIADESVLFDYQGRLDGGAANNVCAVGIGYDTTSSYLKSRWFILSAGSGSPYRAFVSLKIDTPPLGYHYACPVENCDVGTNTFNADLNGTFSACLRM